MVPIAIVTISTGGSASNVSIKVNGGFTVTTATGWVSDATHKCESINVQRLVLMELLAALLLRGRSRLSIFQLP